MKHLLLLPFLLIAGCATNTGDPVKDRQAAAVNREMLRGVVRLISEQPRVIPLEEQLFGPRDETNVFVPR